MHKLYFKLLIIIFLLALVEGFFLKTKILGHALQSRKSLQGYDFRHDCSSHETHSFGVLPSGMYAMRTLLEDRSNSRKHASLAFAGYIIIVRSNSWGWGKGRIVKLN